MSHLPLNIQKVIESFSKLPGIGPKSAERLTFYLLRKPTEEIANFGQTVARLKQGIQYCKTCYHLTTEEFCGICLDDRRDKKTVCVVEGPLDLLALEKANEYKGGYHVLHGIISPVDGIGPEELTIAELVDRAKTGGIKEMVIALNPSMEGEATAAYIMRHIGDLDIKVTRIARGIPMGGNLEYADSQTLKRAFEGRVEY